MVGASSPLLKILLYTYLCDSTILFSVSHKYLHKSKIRFEVKLTNEYFENVRAKYVGILSISTKLITEFVLKIKSVNKPVYFITIEKYNVIHCKALYL